jgi:hypothetical protein
MTRKSNVLRQFRSERDTMFHGSKREYGRPISISHSSAKRAVMEQHQVASPCVTTCGMNLRVRTSKLNERSAARLVVSGT